MFFKDLIYFAAISMLTQIVHFQVPLLEESIPTTDDPLQRSQWYDLGFRPPNLHFMILTHLISVTVTIIGVAQPWHSQSATLHRALASVHSLKPETSWAFLGALYEASSTWEDAETENLSENQILEKASKIAESATGIEASAVLSNCKSAEVTTLLKDHARYSRGNSVHVTPTVLFNGCRVVDFSSSWTIEDWAQFLQNP